MGRTITHQLAMLPHVGCKAVGPNSVTATQSTLTLLAYCKTIN